MSNPAHNWNRVFFGYTVKPHIVPGCLTPALLEDMAGRGHEPSAPHESMRAIERVRMCHLDPGGILHTKEPWRTVRVNNLRVELRSSTVRDYAEAIAKYKPRMFGSRPYYKIHSHYTCIVLLPRQHRAILDALNSDTAAAEAESVAFWRGLKTANDLLCEAQGVVGVKLAGDHPGDRFVGINGGVA